MKQSNMFLVTILIITLGSLPAMADTVSEDWNSGDLGGWEGNTIYTTVELSPEGGVDDSGFLFSHGINGYSGAVHRGVPYVGDFGAYDYTMVRCSLKFFEGAFTDAWLRFRYLDYTHNGWHIPLTTDFSLGQWQDYTIIFNPFWSDVEAMAAGWVQEPDSATFAETMANVLTVEIRVLGSGYLEVGADNFVLSDDLVSTEKASWDGIKSLFR